MTQEEINLYNKTKKEFEKYHKILKDNCMRVISRFSKIEDDLGRSMVDVLYQGDQIYMHESKPYGECSCVFSFYIWTNDTIVAMNETFDSESMFDIKWLMMSEDDFDKEIQKILDEQKRRINEYDSERTE